MFLKFCKSIFLILFLKCIIQSALFANYGFSLDMSKNTINPNGRNINTIVTIENTGDELIAIETFIIERTQDKYGKENQKDINEELFLIYPEQLILKAGEQEVVKVTWIGPENISQEIPYRFIARQVEIPQKADLQNPINKNLRSGIINVLTAYAKTFYVAPQKAIPKITLMNSEKATNSDGEDVLRIILQNNGYAHQILYNLKFLVTKNGKTTTLPANRYANLFSNSTQYFEFTEFGNESLKNLSIDFTYELK